MKQLKPRDRTPEARVMRWIRQDYLGGANQGELAKIIESASSYVANVEAGNKSISAEKARDIAMKVARNQQDERAILLRFQEAVVAKRMPELRPELEFRHLRPREGDDSPRPWIRWAAAMQTAMDEKRVNIKELAEKVGLEQEYVRQMVAGQIMPPRQDVRILAEAMGLDVSRHLLLAGYIPDEGLEILPDIEMLIRAEKVRDPSMRLLLTTVLNHVLEGGVPDLSVKGATKGH